jgi:long-chain acyl-CoA synthetase
MNTTAAKDRIWLASYPPNTASDIGALHYSSIAGLIEDSFKRFASRPAYTCMGKTITYSEMESMSSAIGAWLQSLGLEKGDRVALMMPNILQMPVALAACCAPA